MLQVIRQDRVLQFCQFRSHVLLYILYYICTTSNCHGMITPQGQKQLFSPFFHLSHWKKAEFGDPDSKVHGANMRPTWVLSAPDGPHVVPMNIAIRGSIHMCAKSYWTLLKGHIWMSFMSLKSGRCFTFEFIVLFYIIVGCIKRLYSETCIKRPLNYVVSQDRWSSVAGRITMILWRLCKWRNLCVFDKISLVSLYRFHCSTHHP